MTTTGCVVVQSFSLETVTGSQSVEHWALNNSSQDSDYGYIKEMTAFAFEMTVRWEPTSSWWWSSLLRAVSGQNFTHTHTAMTRHDIQCCVSDSNSREWEPNGLSPCCISSTAADSSSSSDEEEKKKGVGAIRPSSIHWIVWIYGRNSSSRSRVNQYPSHTPGERERETTCLSIAAAAVSFPPAAWLHHLLLSFICCCVNCNTRLGLLEFSSTPFPIIATHHKLIIIIIIIWKKQRVRETRGKSMNRPTAAAEFVMSIDQ